MNLSVGTDNLATLAMVVRIQPHSVQWAISAREKGLDRREVLHLGAQPSSSDQQAAEAVCMFIASRTLSDLRRCISED